MIYSPQNYLETLTGNCYIVHGREPVLKQVCRILKENKDLAITNARKIVDARNYIIHGYDSLSVDILWSIVVNHLPHLKSEVEKLLQE